MCQRVNSAPSAVCSEEDSRTQKPHAQIKQSPDAAAMEKPRWQDTNPLQKWLHAQGGCLGMQIPHVSMLKEILMLVLLPPTLTHAAGLERLCRVWVTGCDLCGKSSTRKILLLFSEEG